MASELQSFYASRDWMPAWVRNGQPTSQAGSIAGFLATAADHGLQPADYNSSEWRADLDDVIRKSPRARSE